MLSYFVQVLRYLVEFELKESDNPRRLLRRGTCAFSILFKLFSEGLYSAKLFLTATLHEPIMQLLVEDEDHLETDPAKLIERFTPAQQERLFGEKGTDEYRRKVQAAVETNEAPESSKTDPYDWVCAHNWLSPPASESSYRSKLKEEKLVRVRRWCWWTCVIWSCVVSARRKRGRRSLSSSDGRDCVRRRSARCVSADLCCEDSIRDTAPSR